MAAHGIPDEGEPETPPAKTGDDNGKAKDDAPKAPAKAKTAEPDSDTPKLTERQLRIAKEFDYTDDETAELDPEIDGPRLEDMGRRYSRKMSEIGHAELERKGGKKPAGLASEVAEAEQQAVEDDDPENLDFQFDGFTPFDDPDNTKRFNRMARLVKTLVDDRNVQKSERQEAERDSFFDSLDVKTFPQYGKGKMSSFAADAAEAKARNELWADAADIQEGISKRRRISDTEALHWALDHVGKDTIKSAAKQELLDKLAQRRRHAVPRAGARRSQGELPSNDEKFDAAMDKFEQEHPGVVIPS